MLGSSTAAFLRMPAALDPEIQGCSEPLVRLAAAVPLRTKRTDLYEEVVIS